MYLSGRNTMRIVLFIVWVSTVFHGNAMDAFPDPAIHSNVLSACSTHKSLDQLPSYNMPSYQTQAPKVPFTDMLSDHHLKPERYAHTHAKILLMRHQSKHKRGHKYLQHQTNSTKDKRIRYIKALEHKYNEIGHLTRMLMSIEKIVEELDAEPYKMLIEIHDSKLAEVKAQC